MFDTSAQPTVTDLRAWRELGVRDDVSDDLLGLALAVAVEEQADDCDYAGYSARLHYACLRRAGRILAAKGAELGVVVFGDLGTSTLSRWDAEIEQAERAYRRGRFA